MVASNAYTMGRKLAQQQRRSKKFQQLKTVSEAESPNESASESVNYNDLTNAGYTVSVGENLPETATHYVENNGINTSDVKLKTKLEEPLAGSLVKSEAAIERIKEKPNKQILNITDRKTVWEKPQFRVKPYKGVSAEKAFESANPPNMLKIKEFEPFPQKRTKKQMKKRNKNKIKKSKVD